jgi:acyl-CoA synthetase (AMP-forming)/AMP-acid ligase II
MTDLVSSFRSNVEQTPTKTALGFLVDGMDSVEELTFEQFDRAARSLAVQFSASCPRGERAVLLLPPGADYIKAFFGCLYAKIIAVPAVPPNRARMAATLPRLLAIAGDAQACAVITTSEVVAMRSKMVEFAPALDKLQWITVDTEIADPSDWRRPALDETSIAFLQYTSGSTSMPKGVVLEHKHLLRNLEMLRSAWRMNQSSIVAGWLPPYHDMGLIGLALNGLIVGASTYLMSPMDFVQQPSRWLRCVTKYRANVSGGPNFAYELCSRRITEEQKAELDLRSWDVAFNGAEPLRAETLRKFQKTFAPVGLKPGALFPCYGLAEATLYVAGNEQNQASVIRVAREELERGNACDTGPDDVTGIELVTSGVAADHTELAIVEPKTGSRLPDNCVGEIWISAPSVARGYWNNPKASVEVFGAAIAPEGGSFLRTGDLGFLRAGNLFVTGRIKDLIIVNGRNIYPQDVELSVEHADAAVRAGGVVAFGSSSSAGTEEVAVVAELEATRSEHGAVIAKIRESVAQRQELDLGTIALVAKGAIPKTSSGKLRRSAVKESLAAGTLPTLTLWRSSSQS